MSNDPCFYENVRAALLLDSRFVDDDAGLHCDGSASPLTNIYAVPTQQPEWDNWSPVRAMPDPREMSHLIVETQSPEWLAEIGRLLAAAIAVPVWIVDSADATFLADQLDPEQLNLS